MFARADELMSAYLIRFGEKSYAVSDIQFHKLTVTLSLVEMDGDMLDVTIRIPSDTLVEVLSY